MSAFGRSACIVAVTIAVTGTTAFAGNGEASGEMSAQRRPSITIYPHPSYPGPNATRHCDSWLAKEYRVSGTVVVPRMRCTWR